MLQKTNLKKEKLELKEAKDVSFVEDAIFTLSNLVAAENHAINSVSMTDNNEEKEKWINTANMLRGIRTRWLKSITKVENSQLWCLNKHLLASIMGLQELGNRLKKINKTKEAKLAFEDSNLLTGTILYLNNWKGVES